VYKPYDTSTPENGLNINQNPKPPSYKNEVQEDVKIVADDIPEASERKLSNSHVTIIDHHYFQKV